MEQKVTIIVKFLGFWVFGFLAIIVCSSIYVQLKKSNQNIRQKKIEPKL
jgi:hypothetical protein